MPPTSLKILLSAYACEPGFGSEAAVGWTWASQLGPEHEVHVITRESNRAAIEAELAVRPLPRVHFSYFDLPPWIRAWKRGNRGVHLYYFLWQIGAYRVARALHEAVAFDVVHHVTFASVRFPSWMGLLGPPFIFGPVGGGEYSPRALWWPLGWRPRIRETLRFVSLPWVRYSPLMWWTFARCSRIFLTSQQTAACVPARFRAKTQVMLAIGVSEGEIATPPLAAAAALSSGLRIVFAGRLTYLKGMEFGLRAFAKLSRQHPDSELTLIGDGPERERWQRTAETLGIASQVRWVPSLAREQFLRVLPGFDALLFPGLHDSGAMVVLEALAAGVPVVCLDIGGPGELVTDACGFKIAADSPRRAVDGMAEALLKLAADPRLRSEMGRRAREHAALHHAWATKLLRMQRLYGELACPDRTLGDRDGA
jgi:glycosyltransferase involved in cell wall biosynthesis